jgi:two-component system sensor histidine kinase YesM
MLHYAVRDNGLGTDQEAIRRKLEGKEENTSGNALALDNINRRIRLKYGEPYGVTFTSSIGAGTLVEIWIPDIRAAGGPASAEPQMDGIRKIEGENSK